MKVTVFTLEHCPNCEKLKELLNKYGFFFTELDLNNTLQEEVISMRMKGIFPRVAPVLLIQTNGEIPTTRYIESEYLFTPDGDLSAEAKAELIIKADCGIPR